MFRTLILRLCDRFSRPAARKPHPENRLQLEILEDRLALSTFIDPISNGISSLGLNGPTGGAATSQNVALAIKTIDNITTALGNHLVDKSNVRVEATSTNVILTNNLINEISGPESTAMASPNNGMGLNIYGEYAAPLSFLTILQNQIYNTQLGPRQVMILDGNATGFQIKNNQVYNVSNIRIGGDFSKGIDPPTGESQQDADSHFADPKFVNAIAADFALLTDKPALGISSH